MLRSVLNSGVALLGSVKMEGRGFGRLGPGLVYGMASRGVRRGRSQGTGKGGKGGKGGSQRKWGDREKGE